MAEVKIAADSGGGSVALKGPASTTGNAAVSLTLPQNDGDSDQVLSTNGSGSLSWVASAGGKLLNLVTASSTTVNQNPSANDTWTDVAPTATITTTAAGSTILVVASTGMIAKQTYSTGVKLLRGSTGIMEWWYYTSDASEWMPITANYVYADTHGQSAGTAITYKFQIYADNNYDKLDWNYNSGSHSTASLNKCEVYLLEIGA